MRVLIRYDGSECVDAALLDLQRAGLPTTGEDSSLPWPMYFYRARSMKAARRTEGKLVLNGSVAGITTRGDVLRLLQTRAELQTLRSA